MWHRLHCRGYRVDQELINFCSQKNVVQITFKAHMYRFKPDFGSNIKTFRELMVDELNKHCDDTINFADYSSSPSLL